MSSFNREALLGAARTHRGMVNMMTLVTAFVLSIMVIHVHRTCVNGKDVDEFKKDKMASMMKTIAILILVVCLLLFSYDIAVKVGVIH